MEGDFFSNHPTKLAGSLVAFLQLWIKYTSLATQSWCPPSQKWYEQFIFCTNIKNQKIKMSKTVLLLGIQMYAGHDGGHQDSVATDL